MDRSLLLVSDEVLSALVRDLRRDPGTASEDGPDVPAISSTTTEPRQGPQIVSASRPKRFEWMSSSSKFGPTRSRLTDLGRVNEQSTPLEDSSPPLYPPKREISLKSEQEKNTQDNDIQRSARAKRESTETLLAPLADVSDRIEKLQATFHESDSLSSRIALGLRWIVGGSGALAAFIADNDGLALANHQAPEAYIAVSPELAAIQDALNSILPRPVEGALVVSVDEHNLLQLLFCQTSIGQLSVGLVVTEPLPSAEVSGIRNIVRASTQPTDNHARTA